ncbi:MAG: 4a-hydroxytetrahydrobiopterin dehydratase [Actinomycetota bacterium]
MTTEDLAGRKCQACTPGTPPLDEAAAAELASRIDPGWTRDANRAIRRELAFHNFRDAFGFACRVALLAEDEGHHPDFELGWGRLALTLTTHAAKGLTDNDFILAAKVDRLAAGVGIKRSTASR